MKLPKYFLVLLLIASFSGMGTAMSAQAKVPVKWQPKQIQIEVLPGTSDLVNIDLPIVGENVTFDLTPSLEKYVSVEQSESSLNLLVSIPQSLKPKTIAGTLQIKEDRRTMAKPLPIKIRVVAPSESTVDLAEPVLPSLDRVVEGDANSSGYIAGRFLVGTSTGTTLAELHEAVSELGGVIVGGLSELGLYQVDFSDPLSQLEMSKLQIRLEQFNAISFASLSALEEPYQIPNDGNRFNRSDWNGSTFQLNPYKFVGFPEVWNIVRQAGGIAVGVVDLGFNAGHYDLIGSAERLLSGFPSSEGRLHGTAVAGIIGAVGDNDRGATGVLWDADMRLYGNEFFASGRTTTGRNISAIDKAIRHGADVINLSGGYYNSDLDDVNRVNKAYERVVGSDLAEEVVFVFATENALAKIPDQYEYDRYSAPSNLATKYENVISVTGLAKNDGDFTPLPILDGFGGDVTIASPGTVCTIGSDETLSEPHCAEGTSFATPMVSGVVALLLGQGETVDSVKSVLEEGARRGGVQVQGESFYALNALQSVCMTVNYEHDSCSDIPYSIEDLRIEQVAPDRMLATWSTAEPASSYVYYGNTRPYVQIGSSRLVTDHAVELPVVPGVDYEFVALSRYSAGYVSESPTGYFTVGETEENQPPTLALPSSGPYQSGMSPNPPRVGDEIRFGILYSDPDDDTPILVRHSRIVFDTGEGRQTSGAVVDDAVDYRNPQLLLPDSGFVVLGKPGTFYYYFTADDQKGNTVRLPAVGQFQTQILPAETGGGGNTVPGVIGSSTSPVPSVL